MARLRRELRREPRESCQAKQDKKKTMQTLANILSPVPIMPVVLDGVLATSWPHLTCACTQETAARPNALNTLHVAHRCAESIKEVEAILARKDMAKDMEFGDDKGPDTHG